MIRSVTALQTDLDTLDVEYTTLSECMAKGEVNDFNPEWPVQIAISNHIQLNCCCMMFFRMARLSRGWAFFFNMIWYGSWIRLATVNHPRWRRDSEALMKTSTFKHHGFRVFISTKYVMNLNFLNFSQQVENGNLKNLISQSLRPMHRCPGAPRSLRMKWGSGAVLISFFFWGVFNNVSYGTYGLSNLSNLDSFWKNHPAWCFR